MATVTVTETDVRLIIQITRSPEDGDAILVTAHSITDVPQVQGRSMYDFDLGPTLTPEQIAHVLTLLNFVEAKVKTVWNIP